MKRLVLSLWISLVLCSLASAAGMDKWDLQATVMAGYVEQKTTDATGQEQRKFTAAVLSGLQFWRSHALYGFSVGASALDDSKESTPRIAPYAAIHLGKPELQFYFGAIYDPQDLQSTGILPTFGLTAAFGGGK